MAMIIKQFILGPIEDNNYLIIDEQTKEAALIDCSQTSPEIDATLSEYGANLKYVLLTHGHFDHVLGVNETKSKYNDCKILMHEGDQYLLDTMDRFVQNFGIEDVDIQKVDGYLNENEIIKLGDTEIKVIHTPGHTPGSVCLLVNDKLFTGDTVFYESVGRTDLPGGSFKQLKTNIQEKIFTLDENIKIYPGHGRSTTVGYEKVNNNFL